MTVGGSRMPWEGKAEGRVTLSEALAVDLTGGWYGDWKFKQSHLEVFLCRDPREFFHVILHITEEAFDGKQMQ
jgi:hypothetical protein